LLKHKVMFGSDFPLISPDRWLSDFERLAIKDEVRPLILKDNAVTALGLTVSGLTDSGLKEVS
jgi:predicted TIM-barrel fold metal-dependent hydrolase